jgi:hypothetical protein
MIQYCGGIWHSWSHYSCNRNVTVKMVHITGLNMQWKYHSRNTALESSTFCWFLAHITQIHPWNMERIKICIVIHSIFCLLNFMLPSCRSYFSVVAASHKRLGRPAFHTVIIFLSDAAACFVNSWPHQLLPLVPFSCWFVVRFNVSSSDYICAVLSGRLQNVYWISKDAEGSGYDLCWDKVMAFG